MSSRQFRENQAYFDQLRANQEYTGFKQARTGRFASDGTVAPDPSDGLTAGFIWIRILPGRQGTRAVIGSGMYGWERIPDLLVMTAINQSGERVCLRPSDTQEAVIAQQDKLANAPKPYVDSVQMTPGLVTANVVAGYGLSVYVQPFTYRTRVITGSLAITPPAVAGTRRMSVVYYDYSADALGVVYGTASALPASAWSLTDAITVALGDTDRIRLGAVLVANGDTVIAPTDKYRYFDCRDWLVLGGVQPGDTLSGITLVNTRERVESDNSGAAYTIDLTLGNVVALTLTADCTLTFPSSLDTGYAYSFTLKTIQDGTGGRDLTFPGSVSWIPDGTPAPDTGIGTIAYYTFVTEDGGTSWYGFFNGDSVNGAPTGATAFTQLTDVPASYSGESHNAVRVNAGETALEFYTPSTGSGVDVIHLQEQQSSGTNGGNFTSGTWRTRVLNTEVADVGGHCSLSSNQFTLDAGTYVIKATAPAFLVNQHQLKLYNISDSADVLLGVNEYAYGNATYGNAVAAHLDGVFTIASSKTFELQHRCATTRNTDGFGIPTSWGTEVYADVLLLKIS